MFTASRLPLLAALVLGTAAASAADHSKHHGHPGMNSAAKAAQAELSAHAVADARGTLWVAHKRGGNIVLSRSGDFGRTWSVPVRVSDEPTDAGADARPKVAVGPKGEVYLTWTRPMSKPFTGEIRLARSLDGGRTFQPPITVHADRQEITHRFDTITVDRDGRVFVAWIDKRDLVAAQALGKDYRGAALYFAVSVDQGRTFRGDYKVADHSCECCRIALVTTRNNTVAALWRHIFAPNIRDHAMATLRADGSASPLERVSFDEWAIDACPHHGPALTEDAAGRLHAVWFSQGTKNAGVFYGCLGAKPDALRRIGADLAERPDIAASGQRVAVAWKEFDGERSQLRGLLSADGGKTWTEHALASTAGASDHPRLVAHQDRFYVVWNTRNEALTVAAFP